MDVRQWFYVLAIQVFREFTDVTEDLKRFVRTDVDQTQITSFNLDGFKTDIGVTKAFHQLFQSFDGDPLVTNIQGEVNDVLL